MSEIVFSGTEFTSGLQTIMDAQDIQPGDPAGYQLCKLLWTGHPLGGKLVEKPISLAQSMGREIKVEGVASDDLVQAFEAEWSKLDADAKIRDTMHIARAYGAGAIAFGFPEMPTDRPLTDPFELATIPGLYFNVYDPLNLAGSIITNQDPNAPDFQKPSKNITAAGQPYHPSRTCVVFHGTPIYLDFQSSSFSFSGRSVFLRCLFSMKSYLQCMQVSDMISRKAGLLVANMEQGGSVLDGLMERVGMAKRDLLKRAVNNQVLEIGTNDKVESLNLQNVDKVYTTSRDAIISDIAAASDVPAIIIKDEAFAQGFANGDQDMMAVVQFINTVRKQMQSLYDYFTRIVQYRAWNPEFFARMQAEYPEALGGRDYKAWFFEARDRFKAKWPSLIQESQGEATERNSKKLKAMSDLFKVLSPGLDPENGARLRQWIADAVNNMPELFDSYLEFDPAEFAANAAELQKQAAAAALAGGEPGDNEGDDGGNEG